MGQMHEHPNGRMSAYGSLVLQTVISGIVMYLVMFVADCRLVNRVLRELRADTDPDHHRRHGVSQVDDPAPLWRYSDVSGSSPHRPRGGAALRSNRAVSASGDRRDEGHFSPPIARLIDATHAWVSLVPIGRGGGRDA